MPGEAIVARKKTPKPSAKTPRPELAAGAAHDEGHTHDHSHVHDHSHGHDHSHDAGHTHSHAHAPVVHGRSLPLLGSAYASAVPDEHRRHGPASVACAVV